MIILLLIIFSGQLWAQQDFAMILSAPHSEVDNYPNFDHSVMKAYRTFGLSGINRDHIYIMSGNGSNPFANKKLKDWSQLTSGVPAAHQKIDGSGSKIDLKKKFQELASKMKAGDHFTLFITGHAQRKNGKVTIRIWGEEELSVEELRAYLKLLPAGVTKHIMGSYCFSGSLMPLTSEPNTCAFAAVDEKTLMKAYMTRPDQNGMVSADDTYTDTYLDTLLKGVTLYDSQKNAQKVDTRNGDGVNSLDWFLLNNRPNGGSYDCDKIPDNKINDLLRTSLVSVSKTKNPTLAFTDYLKAFKKYKDAVAKMTLEYARLTPQLKTAKRGEFTVMIEEIKQNLNLAPIADKASYIREMAREQEFIEKATPEQMKKYLQIKACVNYAIKK